MRIRSELLWGSNIREQERTYELLQEGKLPFGYYLLLATSDGRLEFTLAKMQNNRYFASKDSLIFGIAYTRQEALEMICDILEQIYIEHRYASVAEYVAMLLEET